MRRWFVAVPVLLLTAGLGLASVNSIEPDYEVTGAVQFLGPEVERVEAPSGGFELQGVNPLLSLSGSLGQVSEGIRLSLESQSTRADFAGNGLEPSYEIGADSRSTIMQFRVKSDSSAVAAATIEVLIDRIETELQERQAPYDIPEGDVITIQPLSNNNEPSAGYTDQRRAQLLVLGSSVLFAVLVTGLADVLLRRHGSVLLGRRPGGDDEDAFDPEPDDLAPGGNGRHAPERTKVRAGGRRDDSGPVELAPSDDEVVQTATNGRGSNGRPRRTVDWSAP